MMKLKIYIFKKKKNLKKYQSQIELVFETHYPGHETEITSQKTNNKKIKKQNSQTSKYQEIKLKKNQSSKGLKNKTNSNQKNMNQIQYIE